MNPDHCAILAALKSARHYMDPYPHFLIDSLAPCPLFAELAGTWPSAALFPVPAERSSTSPRRRHVWLNHRAGISEIGNVWSETALFLTSAAFREAMLELMMKVEGVRYPHTTCSARICEEILPYRLEKHRDGPEKLMSFVWYIDGGPEHDLGTTLYGRKTKNVGSNPNSALLFPNTIGSFHGGDWAGPEGYARKTFQLFIVNDDSGSGA